MAQEALWNAVLLGITRLTDPPSARGGKSNLSVLRLPDTISDPGQSGRIRKLAHEAAGRAEFARDWRNRRIAHRDLDVHRGAALTDASRLDVETVLRGLRQIIETMGEHYFGSSEFFLAEPSGGADALLYHLRLAKMLLDERERLLRGGDWRSHLHEEPPEA